MSVAKAVLPSSQRVLVETPNFYLRLLTTDDASVRWASWFDQPEIRQSLNLKTGAKTESDIVNYISKFDQKNNLLIGMFHRTNDFLVGLIDVEINWSIGRYLANMVVGEEEYRHRGVTLEISPGFRRYFFETIGLKVMTATALSTNKPIIKYLNKTGWTLNQVLKNQARSNVDGSPIDLHLYSITREAWDAWKRANPEMLAKMENGEFFGHDQRK